MLLLAIANLTHRKVRAGLSVLAVAIAITLLLILVGLSNGTLNEVSRRIESVDAEIIVRDRHFDLGSMSGGKLWEKEVATIEALQINGSDAVERVITVFLGRVKLAGLSQNVFGVHPADFVHFAGTRKIVAGTLFEDMDSTAAAVESFSEVQSGGGAAGAEESDAGVAEVGDRYLPLVIDERLAHAGKLTVGAKANYGDVPARIVGIVETGVAGRVFAPINALRGANGIGAQTAHMFFVKAAAGLETPQLHELAEKIEAKTKRSATLVSNYGQVLASNFRNLTIFVSLVSVIALVICFLFIVVTMYTIVLERGKEIAILQSLGASRWTVLRQTVQESLLLCVLGTVIGILMTFGAKWLIETVQPLMTIELRLSWLAGAAVVGVGGGCLSALYPGYMALRHDPVEALSFE